MRFRLPLLVLALFASAALAHDHGEHADWYRSLKVPGTGSSCCNDRDCIPTDYRIREGLYEVPVGFMWVAVPRSRVLKDVGNPVGRAVVCRHGETIFCFVPLAEGV
jgi:hypothetical protein